MSSSLFSCFFHSLAETRQQLATAEQGRAALAAPIEAVAAGRGETPASDEEEKAMQPLKSLFEGHLRRTEELRAQEASLAAHLAVEQARWVECNRQLEDIERSVAAVPGR